MLFARLRKNYVRESLLYFKDKSIREKFFFVPLFSRVMHYTQMKKIIIIMNCKIFIVVYWFNFFILYTSERKSPFISLALGQITLRILCMKLCRVFFIKFIIFLKVLADNCCNFAYKNISSFITRIMLVDIFTCVIAVSFNSASSPIITHSPKKKKKFSPHIISINKFST